MQNENTHVLHCVVHCVVHYGIVVSARPSKAPTCGWPKKWHGNKGRAKERKLKQHSSANDQMNLIVTSNVNTHSKIGMQNQKAIFRIQFLNEEKKNSGVHSKH